MCDGPDGASSHTLLFKLKVASFLTRGADISFLSAFPAEQEFLYPPLTYLRPTGKHEVVAFQPGEAGGEGADALKFTVVEVEPQMA